MRIERKEHLLKTWWHLGLTLAAVAEYCMSQTRLRRFLLAAAAGWHLAATLEDWKDFRRSGQNGSDIPARPGYLRSEWP